MRVLMFQPRFAALVEAGQKWQTIRPRFMPRVGELLSLRKWSGKPYRSKQTIVREPVKVTNVTELMIDADGWLYLDHDVERMELCEEWATLDGFRDYKEMLEWFTATHGLPFAGHLIQWDDAAQEMIDSGGDGSLCKECLRSTPPATVQG